MRYLLLFPLIAILLTMGPSGPAEAQPGAPRDQNRDPMDEAIARGLRYLSQTQNPDGSWPINGFGGMMFGDPGMGRPGGGGRRTQGDLAVTALAVMAFLSAGHVPNEGPFGDVIALGIRYVNQQQNPDNGLFSAPLAGGMEMYYHGICTLMLAEVVGMTDLRSADELRKHLEDAVRVILTAQRNRGGNDAGGWRYQVQGFDADLSVAGWQLMALRAAKNVGCDVPDDRINSAVKYVKRCHDPITGGYRYTTMGQVTIPCTGVGILALELCGKEYHRSDEALRAGAYLLKTPLQPGANHFFYGVYYTSQAMFQLGDNYWKGYREKLHDLLLRTNGPQPDGSWIGRGVDDARFGQSYCTAMAVLALTVEYRFLPIYQRFEEPQERE